MPTISTEQVEKAVGALKAYLAGQVKPAAEKTTTKKDLFEREEEFSVIINLRKVPENDKLKPIRIPIPNTIYGRDGVDICLFVKDPQAEWEEFLNNNPVKNVKKVVSLKSLRTDYKSYQHRRELLNQFDFFFADERIIPLLPPLLGSKFFDAKRQPPAVNFASGFKKNLVEARDSTYLHIPQGPVINVKVGHSDQTKDQIAENITAAIPAIVEKIPRKWKNVQSIFVKTATSAALPIYTALPTAVDYVKEAEEKKTEDEEKAHREHKMTVKRAASFGLTVSEYQSAVKAAEKLNMPLSKYVKAKKQRALQSAVEKRGGKGSTEVLQAEQEKVAAIKAAAAELSEDEEEEVEEKPVKKAKKGTTKDSKKVVSLGAKKTSVKGNKK